jgi:hypothetical protein
VIVDKYGRVAGSIDLAALAEMYAQAIDDELKAHYREVAAENGLDLGGVPVSEWGDQIRDEIEAELEPEVEVSAPPLSGPGSGRGAWAAYAESRGYDVTDDMTRDEIIAAVEE